MSNVLHPVTQRIEKLWRAKNFKNQTAFWRTLTVPVNTIQYLKKPDKDGNPRVPSTEVLFAVSQAAPDVNLNWLMLGEGNMLLPHNENPMGENQEVQDLLARLLLRSENLRKEAEQIESEVRRLKHLSTETVVKTKRGRVGREVYSGEQPHSPDLED